MTRRRGSPREAPLGLLLAAMRGLNRALAELDDAEGEVFEAAKRAEAARATRDRWLELAERSSKLAARAADREKTTDPDEWDGN